MQIIEIKDDDTLLPTTKAWRYREMNVPSTVNFGRKSMYAVQVTLPPNSAHLNLAKVYLTKKNSVFNFEVVNTESGASIFHFLCPENTLNTVLKKLEGLFPCCRVRG